MCGIFGEFTLNSDLLEKEKFLALNALSEKRGPDSHGYYSDGHHVQLGFNRLAILDLSENGKQPMHSPSGRYTIVFNGEVYNHQDIRAKMAGGNYRFRGTSDTETIVTALDHFGLEKTVESLDGMFGMAIFDHKATCIHLVRDFAGIKPLHFGIVDHHLVFASQYDQVSKHPKFQNQEIDPSVLKLYLRQHFVPAPLGILKNTFQVMPGEIITIRKDFVTERNRYWEFPNYIEPSIFDEKKALTHLEEHLNEAVKGELLSDVPLGAFLSGGIDSPLICHFAQQHVSDKMKAFTIGSDSEIHDESDDAKQYGDLIGLDLLIRKMDSNQAMDALVNAMDSLKEPFADPSIIPTYLVSKLAREQVTVALSGDGGDELFFGYERFWSLAKNKGLYRFPYPIKYLLYGADKLLTKNKRINSNVLFPTNGEGHFIMHSRNSQALIDELFPDLRNVALPAAFDVYDYNITNGESNLLGKMKQAEFYGMMQKTLHKVDRASMANSLEIRVPFLKKSFIEASFQIDPYLSYGPNKKKQLLKSLLKNKFPSAPIDNRKRGFSIPLDKWIREGLKQPFQHALLDEKNMAQSLGIDRTNLEQLFNNHVSNLKDNKWPLFTIFSLFKWKICQEK